MERRSSSWMRYSAVPASALLLGACLAPEDPFSKSLGASEIEKSFEEVRICNRSAFSSSCSDIFGQHSFVKYLFAWFLKSTCPATSCDTMIRPVTEKMQKGAEEQFLKVGGNSVTTFFLNKPAGELPAILKRRVPDGQFSHNMIRSP